MIRTNRTYRAAAIPGKVVALGVACLLMRALVPVGYMPGNLLAGEYMVLCPVGLPAAVAAALHSDHGSHARDIVDADRTCPIGSALKPAFLPIEPAEHVVLWQPQLLLGEQANVTLLSRHPVPYRSRAPPRA